MLSHKPGLGRLSPHFFHLNYYGVPNKALVFPYNKQTSSAFGLFHIDACVRVVPCINYISENDNKLVAFIIPTNIISYAYYSKSCN